MGYWNINVLLVNNPSVSLNWDFEWEHQRNTGFIPTSSNYFHLSMDWFKGKSTEKNYI